MKVSDEWWNSDVTEEQNNPNVETTNLPKYAVEEKVKVIKKFEERKKVIIISSAMFLFGMFSNWGFGRHQGFSYILDFVDNISWFIEYNYLLDNEFNLLKQFGRLIFIISPLLLSINFSVMWYYLLKKKIDIGKTASYFHFSIFITIFVTQTINWGILPLSFEYGIGFNIILLSGFGLNPYTASKIFGEYKI